MLAAALALPLVVTAACSEEPVARAPREDRWLLPGETPKPRGSGGLVRGGTAPVLGTGEHPLGLKWNWSQRETLDVAADLRGGATFFEVEWCAVEPEPGVRQWGRVDRVVRESADLGHSLLLKLRTGSCWATVGAAAAASDPVEGGRKTASSLPVDPEAYADFVRAVAERYAPQGVSEWAVENEVDAVNSWSGPVADYAPVARLAADVLRAVDPQARVLDAGPSSTAYGVAMAADLLEQGEVSDALSVYSDYYERRQAGDASRFPRVETEAELSAVLASGRGRRAVAAVDSSIELVRDGVVDAYQLHYYEPSEMLPVLLAWLDERLPPGTPVEAWETGVAWPGPSYDESEHAAETMRLLVTMLGAGVQRVVYLPLAYTPGTGRKEVFRGLVTPEGQPLPALRAYEQVMAATVSGGPAVPVEVGSGLEGAGFAGEEELTVVIWQAAGSGSATVTPPAGATATDATGAEVPLGDALDVASSPVVLHVPGDVEDLDEVVAALAR